ncbi:AAA family ATPase [Aliikangiella coralliicola]|uniref:AAA family ATPase n=1 Tax=Aliikangiella coralliicola TaxID=2592383 RepID=A0A545U0G2_9GAMM|nr:AAA family ATPase [Aliikangiella coralliicola]TQV82951.1 AAA family ATPase [Aliikangiella coralliicola]
MHQQLETVVNQLNEIILGKKDQIKLALVCLLAKGHLLIEDLPGMGKTTLAHALAKVLGLDFQRIQFTSDLLPADIIGSAIYRRSDETFKFHQGPIFTQVILADEVNRATPKSQSALLEAMEEYQVTSEGVSRKLPEPFFVIATQNPFHQIGTYPLPESQLDRFLIRISLGYPAQEVERLLFKGQETRIQIEALQSVLNAEKLLAFQREVEAVTVTDTLLDYLQALVAATRNSTQWSHGLSPRGGLALLKAAKAWALLEGRDFVVPEDIQAVWEPVASHRLMNQTGTSAAGSSPVLAILESTEIPR